MENQEIIKLEVQDFAPATVQPLDFEAVSKAFIEFLRTELTNPATGHFYQNSACNILLNLQSVMVQNEGAAKILQNTQVMGVFGQFIGREDFLNDKGDFNPKCIFSFAKDGYGLDLLEQIPSMIRPFAKTALGL